MEVSCILKLFGFLLINKTVMVLSPFLSPNPNTVVVHILRCINRASLKQTNVSWTRARIDLVYFVKPLEERRAEGTEHAVGVLEAVFCYFKMFSELPQQQLRKSGKNDIFVLQRERQMAAR